SHTRSAGASSKRARSAGQPAETVVSAFGVGSPQSSNGPPHNGHSKASITLACPEQIFKPKSTKRRPLWRFCHSTSLLTRLRLSLFPQVAVPSRARGRRSCRDRRIVAPNRASPGCARYRRRSRPGHRGGVILTERQNRWRILV